MSKDTIFQKAVVKATGLKVNVVSFALPAVAPGSIIEYRWSKNVGEYISRYLPLDVQAEFPIDEVTFNIKPVTSQYVAWPAMRLMPFGCKIEPATTNRPGFSTYAVHNVPAFHEEPYMSPEYSAKEWILIYYEENSHSGSDKFWTDLGHSLYAEFGVGMKVNGDVRAMAQKVTAGAASDDEKIKRLANYCRDLKDVQGRETTTEERAKAKANRTPADTLKQGKGSPREITLAFVALASAAGFDARMAKMTDRRSFLFNPADQSAFFLNDEAAAVNVAGKWKFYDVTNRNVPVDQLPWYEQGIPALITDPKKPEFVNTPMLNSDTSRIQRMGDFKLSADGSLEGSVREIYMGNRAEQ